MPVRLVRSCLVLVVAFAAILVGGCGSAVAVNGNAFPGDGGGPGSTGMGVDGSNDGGLVFGDGGLGAATSISITPSSSTLTVTDLATPPSVTLTAQVTYSGGAVVTTAAAWTVDRLDIASVDSGGVVTPTTLVYGQANVTATAAGLSATAAITVNLALVVHDSSIPSSSEMQLAVPTTNDPVVASFAYPYDATVFPLGLLPPELQWNGGSAGDQYLLHFTAANLDLQVFTTADPPSRYTLPQSLWNTLASTAAGASTNIQMTRLSAGTAYSSADEGWLIANADLRGIIYYWEINRGQLVQLDLATGTNSPVFTAGASTALGTPAPLNSASADTPPWQDNGAGSRCVACHSVSKDGSTLVSVFSRDQPGSTGPLGAVSLKASAVTAIADYTTDSTYDSLSPDGTFAVVNYENKTMALLQTSTMTPLASPLDGQANLCDPVFSPDGTLFAFASNCDPGFGYPVEFRTSDLSIYSFSPTAPYFNNAITFQTSTGVGDAIAFPSFSPDSKWVFYQRGDYSRAKYTNASAQNVHGNDDLYVASAITPGAQIPLTLLNGDGYLPTADQHLAYAPTVNPIAVGGYFWVVFTTPRDYGNEMVAPGTAYPNDPTYANHKQLWVAAIDATIGTTDPSHPAFWLPGQDPTSVNMFGYWALAPCKATEGAGASDGGEDAGTSTCTAGFECCSGFCENGMCVSQSSGCSAVGDKCTASSDCCTTGGNSIACIGGFCEPQAPQ